MQSRKPRRTGQTPNCKHLSTFTQQTGRERPLKITREKHTQTRAGTTRQTTMTLTANSTAKSENTWRELPTPHHLSDQTQKKRHGSKGQKNQRTTSPPTSIKTKQLTYSSKTPQQKP
mgnify:CR=1 FL=1